MLICEKSTVKHHQFLPAQVILMQVVCAVDEMMAYLSSMLFNCQTMAALLQVLQLICGLMLIALPSLASAGVNR